MRTKKKEKIGEKNKNKYGNNMVIIDYRNSNDLDVKFVDYGILKKKVRYHHFKEGAIKSPYDKTVFGIGFIGEGDYEWMKDGKQLKVYKTWCNMLKRCYYQKWHEESPWYEKCEVDNEWHNFQNFAQWYYENYYEVEGEEVHLDKDILVQGNKVYSPDKCVFVPEKINRFITTSKGKRKSLPIGVSFHEGRQMYKATCNANILDKPKQGVIGFYHNPEEAFNAYKSFKEDYIKEVADKYQDVIPEKLYTAMYNYTININD